MRKVTFKVRTVIAIVLAVTTMVFYFRITRPVGWFDAVVALILAGIVFYIVKKFRGIELE